MAHKIYIEQEDGEIRTIEIAESDDDLPTESSNDRESYGVKEDAIARLQEVHETIRLYTRYAIGAFKNLGDAQVEEVTLKFGLKISGEAGIPVLTKASAESNFEIQVKCKFPPK
ncbi:CU044_2847 family protein [Tumidithrix elongata RA019]|uniref:CU044_2847 family protein n=1 Tax=Tumidithrix elongata BACA0141 TaxID=2716417 RepID=A0AAW9PWD2_9CYAN|nr:CU044_2847 family protein [Tumidithrix elongata RA019]